ncbi:MAG TPA: hypothetical protein VHD56_00900 [Tepidisphaeraceae bacterium]|nr:hypothetical protein [Tepidisphaeraceae bacterium]
MSRDILHLRSSVAPAPPLNGFTLCNGRLSPNDAQIRENRRRLVAAAVRRSTRPFRTSAMAAMAGDRLGDSVTGTRYRLLTSYGYAQFITDSNVHDLPQQAHAGSMAEVGHGESPESDMDVGTTSASELTFRRPSPALTDITRRSMFLCCGRW